MDHSVKLPRTAITLLTIGLLDPAGSASQAEQVHAAVDAIAVQPAARLEGSADLVLSEGTQTVHTYRLFNGALGRSSRTELPKVPDLY